MMTELSRKYLNSRGVSDDVIARYSLGGDDEKIIFPVQGFNKYRSFPQKRYWYDRGFKAALFGLPQLEGSKWAILTEGELDTLCLASHGFPAVSGTGGAGTWKEGWVSELPPLIFVCYDNDKTGQESAKRIHWAIPNSRIIQLPQGYKDACEFMATHTRADFEELIRSSIKIPKPFPRFSFCTKKPQSKIGNEIEKAKSVPVSAFIQFRNHKARCIWHNEATASMHYYEKENRVYCFGCDKRADVLDVVMKLKGCSFDEAIKTLC